MTATIAGITAAAIGGACSCGAPTVRTLGAIGYCDTCADMLLAPIRARVAGFGDTAVGQGRGLQAGPLRADWGDEWADLECDVCEASWVGPIGEPCAWCVQRLERTVTRQRRLLLHPDLPDRGDRRRIVALEAWAERLANGVRAGVIDEPEALTAIARNR